ncbi:MAG: ABC transporter substrate-binding protein [Bacteroidetes bacterium]|nr:MAG: ABC transporter substrate-binding protein [Bacteroidota bacterium]
MDKKKLKISAVSYLNTLPFLYGIKNSGLTEKIIFEQDIPSICASKLLNNEVDIALVPIAVIPLLKESYIISNYCIGASGKVKTVLLLSDVPLNEIKSIYLDYQSKTSVNLIRILAKKYWKINPDWKKTTKGYEKKIKGNNAGLIIGDRTFHLEKNYKYVFDLAEEWEKFTELPFVFAAWVSNKPIDKKFVKEFNKALLYGLENIEQVVSEFYAAFPDCKIDMHKYFTQYISYELDNAKKQAMKLFFEELNEIGSNQSSIFSRQH